MTTSGMNIFILSRHTQNDSMNECMNAYSHLLMFLLNSSFSLTYPRLREEGVFRTAYRIEDQDRIDYIDVHTHY